MSSTTMSLQPAIEYIITRLQTIDGLENVYECLPLVGNRKDLRTYFDENLQGWEVGNLAGDELLSSGNCGEWQDTIGIDGWTLYKDATTKRDMQRKVDAIKTLFKHDLKLGKTVSGRSALKLRFFQADWFYETLTVHCQFYLGVTLYY